MDTVIQLLMESGEYFGEAIHFPAGTDAAVATDAAGASRGRPVMLTR